MEFRMSWMFLLTMEDHFENRKAALRNGVRVCEMEMMKKYYARHAAVQVREAGQQMPSGPVGGESSASQIRRSDPLDGSAEQAPGEGVVTEDTEVAKGDDTGSAEMDKGKVAKGKEVVRGDATGSPETSKGKEVARGNDTAFRSAGKGKEVARGNDPRSPSTGKGTEVDRGNDPRSPLAGKGKEVDRGDDDGSAETDQVKKEDIEEEGSQSQRQDVVTFEERMKPCKATYESDDELPRK